MLLIPIPSSRNVPGSSLTTKYIRSCFTGNTSDEIFEKLKKKQQQPEMQIDLSEKP